MANAWGVSWGTSWGNSWGATAAATGGGKAYAPPIPELRRMRTQIPEVDEELLALLGLNVIDESVLVLMALANYEPQ